MFCWSSVRVFSWCMFIWTNLSNIHSCLAFVMFTNFLFHNWSSFKFLRTFYCAKVDYKFHIWIGREELLPVASVSYLSRHQNEDTFVVCNRFLYLLHLSSTVGLRLSLAACQACIHGGCYVMVVMTSCACDVMYVCLCVTCWNSDELNNY